MGPFFLYLLVFLLWFPGWQHSPDALFTRAMGYLFGAMTAVLILAAVLGRLASWVLLMGTIAMHVYETYLKKDNVHKVPRNYTRKVFPAGLTDAPALHVTKALRDGTPIRGTCPLCGTEFSTEAFASDRSYPHESRLQEWYRDHFVIHLQNADISRMPTQVTGPGAPPALFSQVGSRRKK